MTKCDELNYHIDTSDARIVASLSFVDYDQSMRFMEVLIKFILAERKPPQILENIAWYCPVNAEHPPSDQ